MRKYSKLSRRLWSGDLGHEMRVAARKMGDVAATEQGLAPYLIGNQHSNMIGLYYLPVGYICVDLGWTLEGASKTLRSLSTRGFARVDWDLEWVWVVESFRHEFPADRGTPEKPDNSSKAIAGFLEEAANSFLCRDFCDHYGESHKALLSPFEAPSKGLTKGSSRARQDQDPDQEQHQEEESRPADAPARPRTDDPLLPGVEESPVDAKTVASEKRRKLQQDVESVWETYARFYPRWWTECLRKTRKPRTPELTSSTRELIAVHLRDGQTVASMKASLQGVKHNAFHLGTRTGKPRLSPADVFKKNSKVNAVEVNLGKVEPDPDRAPAKAPSVGESIQKMKEAQEKRDAERGPLGAESE